MASKFPDYSEEWPRIARAMKKRDGGCCQKCGKGGRGIELNVHHIVSLSDGGTDDPDNLITLCRDCHSLNHPHMQDTRQTSWGEPKVGRVTRRVSWRELKADLDRAHVRATSSRSSGIRETYTVTMNQQYAGAENSRSSGIDTAPVGLPQSPPPLSSPRKTRPRITTIRSSPSAHLGSSGCGYLAQLVDWLSRLRLVPFAAFCVILAVGLVLLSTLILGRFGVLCVILQVGLMLIGIGLLRLLRRL